MSGHKHDRPGVDHDRDEQITRDNRRDGVKREQSNEATQEELAGMCSEAEGGYLDSVMSEDGEEFLLPGAVGQEGPGRDGAAQGGDIAQGGAQGQEGGGEEQQEEEEQQVEGGAGGISQDAGGDAGDEGDDGGDAVAAIDAAGQAGGDAPGGGDGGGAGGGQGGPSAGLMSEPRGQERAPQLGVEGGLGLDMSGLDADLHEAVECQTGMDVGGHQAGGQAALAGLTSDIGSAQAEDVGSFEAEAESLAGQIRSTWLPKVEGAHSQAVAAITGGYASAQAQVCAAGETQLGEITGAETVALADITAAGEQAQSDLTDAVTAANEVIAGYEAEWPAKFTAIGPEKTEAFVSAATGAADQVRANKAEIVASFGESSGTPMQKAEAELMRKAAGPLVDKGAAEMAGKGATAATAALAELDLATPVTTALGSLKSHVEGKQTEGKAAIEAAVTEAKTSVSADARAAEKQIGTDVGAAETQLTEDEQGATDTADESKVTLTADVETQATDARTALLESSADVAESYRDAEAQINAAFAPGEFVDVETVQTFVDAQKEVINGLQEDHAAQLSAGSSRAQESAATALGDGVATLEALGTSSGLEAEELACEKTGVVEGIGSAFVGGLEAVAAGVETAATTAVAPLEEDFTAMGSALATELQGGLDAANLALDGQATAYAERLATEVTDFASQIDPSSVASALEGVLNGICTDVYGACWGMGTDENRAHNALKKIDTLLQGQATEWLFRQSRSGKNIRTVLSDDMSGNDLNAALSYLSGNTAAGAQYELSANMRWYGDDEAQIEHILRSLSPEEREELQKQDGWDEVSTELQDNLGGTDLNVTDALLVNQDARADAYRLQDELEKARRNMDTDAVHAALTGMDPDRRAQIAQELHAIQNDNIEAGDTEAADVVLETAYANLVTFATEKREQERHVGHGQTVTVEHELTGADYDLAHALVREGNDHENADAARFEIERTRRGGPREEFMEMALYGSEKEQDAMRVPGSEGYEAGMQADAERRARVQARWASQYGKAEDAPASMRDAIVDTYQDSDDKENDAGMNREQEVHLNMLDDGMNSSRVIARQLELSADQYGTDEERTFRGLEGATPEQIREADRLHTQNTGEGFRERLLGERGVASGDVHYQEGRGSDIFTEFSGVEARRLETALLGDQDYWTDRERYRGAEVDHRYSVGEEAGLMARMEGGQVPDWVASIPGGSSLVAFDQLMGADDEEAQMVRDNFARMQELMGRTEGEEFNADAAFDADGNLIGDAATRDEFERTAGFVSGTSQNHREAQDAIASAVTTGIAVVGGVVATFFTGGVAAPMIVAALTGAASVGANQAIRGGRYGWEAMAHDLGVTAIDVVAAGGTKYLDGAEWLNRAIPDKRLRALAIAGGEDFLKEGGRTALNDSTWEDGGKGLGGVFESGARGGLSNIFKTGLGQVIGPTDGVEGWQRALWNTGTKSAEEVSGTAFQLGWDATVRGKQTDSEAALLQLAQSGGIGAFKGLLDGESLGHRPNAPDGPASSEEAVADEVLSTKANEYEQDASRVRVQAEESDARLATPLRDLAIEHDASVDAGGEGVDPARTQAMVDGAEGQQKTQYQDAVETMQDRVADVQDALQAAVEARNHGPEEGATVEGPEVDGPEVDGSQVTDAPQVDGPDENQVRIIEGLSASQRRRLQAAIAEGQDPNVALSDIADTALMDRLIELEGEGAITDDDVKHVMEPNSDGERAGRLSELEKRLAGTDGDDG